MTVRELWDESERHHADRPAVVTATHRYTYGEIGAWMRRVAADLDAALRERPARVVALLVPNCAEFVVCYLAAVRIGAAVHPLDDRLTDDEIIGLLCDSGSGVLVVDRGFWHRIRVHRDRMPPHIRIVGIGFAEDGVEAMRRSGSGSDSEVGAPPPLPDTTAELMCTAGTTGGIKTVVRSHANVVAAINNSINGFGYRETDIIAISMPLSHSSALTSQLLPLLSLGGTVVLEQGFEPGRLLETLVREDVTCLRGVPTMWKRLMLYPEFGAQALPALRLLINSSAAIEPEAHLALKQRFPAAEVLNSYGLTEASTCTVLPDAMAILRPNSVGAPIEGVEMSVRDEGGHPCDEGAAGEIWVRGANVCSRYGGSGATHFPLDAEGWLRTGDAAYRDTDGYYYLQGRLDDVVNTGGLKVAPVEVEKCIRSLEGIAEVVVVGIPHRALGQALKAIVVPDGGRSIEPRLVKQHCARHLPSHKVPLVVEMADSLPRNSLGKVVRSRLDGRTDG